MRNEIKRLLQISIGTLQYRHLLPFIAIIGFILRLVLLFFARHNSTFLDELDYQSIGVSLWRTRQFNLNGIASAFRPPAEPIVIAIIYSLCGYHQIVVKIFESLLLTVLPFQCFRLGRLLGLSVVYANLGALLATLHPALAYSSTTLFPTVLTSVTLTLGLVLCTSAEIDRDTKSSVAGAFALGIAGLSTTTFTPLPALISLYFFWKRQTRIAVIIGILGLLPAVAWIARNQLVMGQAVIATNGGINLRLGANDSSTPESGNWISAPKVDASGEVAVNQEYLVAAKHWISEHPLKYAYLCFSRGLLVADSVGNPVTRGMHSGIGEEIVGWLMLPIVLLGYAGLWLCRRTAASCFTTFSIVLVVVTSATTIVKPRFRFPCDPALGVFACASISALRRKKYCEDRVTPSLS